MTDDKPQAGPSVNGDSSIVIITSLLKEGLESPGEASAETFESVLEQANVPDTHWRLGNYEVIEEIGRGGMGVIYRARQRISGRIVAVKRVLAYQADSHETLARFRREAQTIASLDHPNILPIYEISETEDGVPFFSMKLALGGSLREAAASLRKDTHACVRLMARVARAVAFAHAKGILHRDLQPGNILLDAEGEPLVSDFGLAKWLDQESDLTQTLTTFGTPGYIAPEQAEGAHFSSAADIYSLGAILFNLLAGRPPFVGPNALSVIRQASEAPAPKLRAFASGLDRDIETMIARCLEREPKARYQSVAALADDLECWLEGRPIVARPVSPPARFWRWSKRNPKLVAATATAVLSVIAATSFSFWNRTVLAKEVAKIREGIIEYPQLEAQLRASKSEKEREVVEQQVLVQIGQKLKIDPRILREKLPSLAQQLKHSPNASSYERASAAYTAKDYLEAERLALKAAEEARQSTNVPEAIKAFQLAGLSAQRNVEYARAMQRFREAEKLTDRERTPLQWAEVAQEIGELLKDQGNYKESEGVLRDVTELRSRLLGPGHPDSLRSHNALADALIREGKYAEAETTFHDLVKLSEKHLGPEHPDTLASRQGLARSLFFQGKGAEAEAECRSVLDLREKVLGPEHPDTLLTRNNLANTLNSQGKYAEAEVELRTLCKLQEKVLGPEHPHTLGVRLNLATDLYDGGKYAEAEAELRSVITLQEKVIGPEHPDTLLSRKILADDLRLLGRYTEAEAENRAVVKLREKVLGPEHPDTLESRNFLAATLIAKGEYSEAEGEYRAVIKLLEKKLGPEHREPLEWRNFLAWTLSARGKYLEAETEIRAVIERLEKVVGPKYPGTLNARDTLASILCAEGKPAEAEAEIRPVIRLNQEGLGPEDPQTVGNRQTLADALAGQGKYAEAEAEYSEVIRIRTKVLGAEHPDTLNSRSDLARTLMAQGKDANADMRQVIQLREKVIGPEHPDTLESCYDFASGLEREAKNQEALQFAQRAADGAEKVLGSDHPATIKYKKLATDLMAKR